MAEEHTPLQRCLAASDKNRRPYHTQVSHNWLYHLDANAGSVLTPHDYITHVQKRLSNRLWAGGGQCRCCVFFPDLEHAETCSTAEATRGHYACVHAVVCGMKLADQGITTEPRGPTASQSRPADIFITAAVPGRSAALDVCGLLHCRQQLEETQRMRRLIANSRIAEMKVEQQEVDPRKVRPIQMGSSCGNMSLGDFWCPVR